MSNENAQALVTTDWLAGKLDNPDVVVLDGTYHLPTAKRDAEAEFAAKHIPGAIRFNIDAICDPDDPLPHMMPTPELFAAKVSALGIGNEQRVVVYDVYGMQSAARTWWMFRVFGHDNVSVLDGGLPKWEAEERRITAETKLRTVTNFAAGFRPELVRGIDDVRAVVEAGGAQIVDARAIGRFTAIEPEPRPGMRSGHMPGAINLPFTELLDPAFREFKDTATILDRVQAANIDLSQPVITSCGSGVTACAVSLALFLAGKEDAAVYDGSWSEWGGRQDTPIVSN
ncbi:MAG: 3-mercaptopyruvate sulfurtransferase [Alphaproteobacteria bacterium]|nr:3-mercaptopyruvate sulfurtransferase [Alphaproteobacteria bacterium]